MAPYSFIKLKGCTFYNLCKQHTWMLFICILCEHDWNLISHLANFTAIRKTTFCASKRAIYSQIELVSIETNTLFYPGAMYISDSWPFLWGLWSCRDQSPRASLLPVSEDRTPFVPFFVITRWNKKFVFYYLLRFFQSLRKKTCWDTEFLHNSHSKNFFIYLISEEWSLSERENDKSRVNYIQCHCCLAVINSIVHKESILFVEDNFEIFLRLQLIHNVTLWYFIFDNNLIRLQGMSCFKGKYFWVKVQSF